MQLLWTVFILNTLDRFDVCAMFKRLLNHYDWVAIDVKWLVFVGDSDPKQADLYVGLLTYVRSGLPFLANKFLSRWCLRRIILSGLGNKRCRRHN